MGFFGPDKPKCSDGKNNCALVFQGKSGRWAVRKGEFYTCRTCGREYFLYKGEYSHVPRDVR